MARLNEPPFTTESIDALKRRFIRQNRELARVNSTQSLRIRNLEAEISRLLTENIALREQAIKVTQEAERWRNSHEAATLIAKLKATLETKLREVDSLVTELGTISDRTSKQPISRRNSGLHHAVKSPDQKEWRNRQSIAGVVRGDRVGEEGRLPAIIEDKNYPRKTLESQEMQALIEGVGSATDSPDLGPPPVAHFEAPDPINFGTTATGRPCLNEHETDHEQALALSSNLETRRRRRTSALLQDMSANSIGEARLDMPDVAQELKTGAKRKLEARELDDNSHITTSIAGTCVFPRKVDAGTTTNSKASRFTRQPAKTTERFVSPQRQPDLARRVLAPKSTNSPTKPRSSTDEKRPVLKVQVQKTRHQTGFQLASLRTKAENQDTADDGVVLDRHIEAKKTDRLPKTPAGLDFLSPVSTEPSSKGQQPQEMALTNSVEDVLNGSIGRSSRRARVAVSYAEPNLRDKMRRPGKEFVGAVEGIDRTRERDASVRSESVDRGRSEGACRTKKEQDDSSLALRNLPNAHDEVPSPLQDKSSRSLEDSIGSWQHGKNPGQDLQGMVSRLSIYDPPVVSPEDDSSNVGPNDGPTAKKNSVKTRRHSTNPPELTRSASDAALRSSVKAPPPRPSSAVGQKNNTSSPELADFRRPNIVHSLRPSEQQISNGRTERMSARRRSMMV